MRLLHIWSGIMILIASTIASAAVLGIDFGQEFTKGSVVGPGAAFELVLSSDSKRKDVSGISFKKTNSAQLQDVQRVYGNSANSLFTRLPENSAFYLKSLLGRSLDSKEAAEFRNNFPALTMVDAGRNRSAIAFQIGSQNFTVEELVAMQLDNLSQRAAGILGDSIVVGKMTGQASPVRDVAVAVPPQFDAHQRRALKDAVDIAGLKLISLVNDGVAVAVNFASTRVFEEKEQYYMVYDVGAGSTKATLVSIKQGEVVVDPYVNLTRPGPIIDVQGTGYSTEFSGQALTSRLRDLLVEKFAAINTAGITVEDVKNDFKAYNKFWKEAERAKIVLSANNEVSTSIESVKNDVDFRAKVSRDEFNAVTADLLQGLVEPIQAAFRYSRNILGKNVEFSDLSAIIIAGGGSRVPFVQKKLLQVVNGVSSKISKNVNADEASVLGTTLRGVGISKIFRSKDMQVIDRALWNYDVMIGGDEVFRLFPQGIPLGTFSSLPLTNNNTVLELYENGVPIVSYIIDGVDKAVQGLLSDKRLECIDENEVKVAADFRLLFDGTVELEEVKVTCSAKERKTASTTAGNKTDTAEADTELSGSATSSESQQLPDTSASAVPQLSKRSVKYTTRTIGVKGLSSVSKGKLQSVISLLNRVDASRLEKEQLQNELESSIYRVRELLVSHELGSDHDLLSLAQFQNWLEEEGQSASTKELSAKIAEVLAFRDKFIPRESPESSSDAAGIIPEDINLVSDPDTASASPTDAPKKQVGKKQASKKFMDAMKSYKTALNDFAAKLKVKGVDFAKEQEAFGLDLLNLETYINSYESVNSEEALIESLEYVTDLLNEVVLASARSDFEKVSEAYAKLAAKLDERTAFENAKRDGNNSGIKDKAEAIKQFFKNAASSLDVLQSMKASETGAQVSHDEL